MILITGATGLVGAHLALELIQQGQSVSAIYQENESTEKVRDLFKMYGKEHLFININWIVADITDIPSLELAFKNCSHVYHCAGKISFNPADQELLRKVNIEGTANIVNFCLAKNIQKLCVVSSIASISSLPNISKDNNHEDERFIDEETDWNPETYNSDYAISKYGAEMEIWRGQQEGLQVVIVNPGIILGPLPKSWNRNEGSFKTITTVANGQKYYTTGTTGIVGVHDVVSCMIQLMKSTITGERYILVSENFSFQEITTLIAQKFGVQPPKKEFKKWMANVACKLNSLRIIFFQKRTLSRANMEWLFEKNKYSNQKIKTELNFEFEPIEAVLQKIADNY